MKNEFVPYDLALKLKEIGFDKECFYICVDGCDMELPKDNENIYQKEKEVSIPLWQQAFSWFMEEHNYICWIDKKDNVFRYNIDTNKSLIVIQGFKTYEEARLECLKKLIKIVEDEKPN